MSHSCESGLSSKEIVYPADQYLDWVPPHVVRDVPPLYCTNEIIVVCAETTKVEHEILHINTHNIFECNHNKQLTWLLIMECRDFGRELVLCS